MKNQWCDCIADSSRRLWNIIEQPTWHHSLHSECGIYKKKTDRSPLASVRVDHECAVPLVRVIALLGVLILATTIVTSLCHAVCRHACSRHYRLRLCDKKRDASK